MAAKRAKDLHSGKIALVSSYHKEPYLALEEIQDGMIQLVYKTKEQENKAKSPQLDADDKEDE